MVLLVGQSHFFGRFQVGNFNRGYYIQQYIYFPGRKGDNLRLDFSPVERVFLHNKVPCGAPYD